MALFTNSALGSFLKSVEFVPTEDGNSTFFRLKPGADTDVAKQFVTTQLGQQITAETKVGDQAVLVTSGNKNQQELLAALKERGDKLSVPQEKEGINLWKARGWASMIGQPLQLLSGFLQKGPPDAATIGFAALNITANASNIVFGAQKEPDTHQLLHLKTQINEKLTPYLADGKQPLAVEDNRFLLRPENQTPKSLGTKTWDFMKRNSVTVFEIGLRYVAAVVLAFPLFKTGSNGEQNMEHFKKGFGEISKGKFGDAFNTLKTNDNANLYAGLTYIGGKTLALTSKVPDPYNPKKHTALDTFREKFTFPISSVIETVAATTIALDRLNLIAPIAKATIGLDRLKSLGIDPAKKREISLDGIIGRFKNPPKWLADLKGKKTRDWLGGIGGLLFTGGLIIRIFAPFGSKEVDMNELNAHATDSLAQVPQEKLPQALADTAAYITEHFKEKKLEFGKVYTQLANDLQKYNGVTVPSPGLAGESLMAEAGKTADPEAGHTANFSSRSGMKRTDLGSVPRPGTYQDLASASMNTAAAHGM